MNDTFTEFHDSGFNMHDLDDLDDMSWNMVLGAEVPDDSVHRHAPFLHPERRTMKIVVNFLSAFLTVGSHSKKNKRFSCYLEPKSEITKFFSQIQFECPCMGLSCACWFQCTEIRYIRQSNKKRIGSDILLPMRI